MWNWTSTFLFEFFTNTQNWKYWHYYQLYFSQAHKISNIGIIANFIFPYVYNFLPFFHYMMLVNVKFNVSGIKGTIFQGYILHWSSSFLIAQIRLSWQYWHSSIAESFWKTLFFVKQNSSLSNGSLYMSTENGDYAVQYELLALWHLWIGSINKRCPN